MNSSYACVVWRYAADSYLRILQIMRVIDGAPWYVSNQQLNDDLDVSYIAEHIRNLAQLLETKIPGVEEFLVRQLGRYFFYPRDE